MIEENFVVVITLIGICVLADVAILILAKIITPRSKPTVAKIQRFESGNPPVGMPKFVLPMQYVGFLLMFLGCEPIVVLFLILSPAPHIIPTLLLSLILLLLGIYFSYKYAYEIAYR